MDRNKFIFIAGSILGCVLNLIWNHYFPQNSDIYYAAPLIGLLFSATGIGLISAGVSAFGVYQQGQAAKAQAETEAAIAEYNAKLAERQAEEERRAAEYKARAHEAEARKFIGKQTALYGISGVEFRGTPLSVIEESAAELEADRLQILQYGEISAGQRTAQAQISRMEGAAAKARGAAAYRGSILSATGTALTGLSRIF